MCERHNGYIYTQGNDDEYGTEGCGGCHCCAFNGQGECHLKIDFHEKAKIINLDFSYLGFDACLVLLM